MMDLPSPHTANRGPDGLPESDDVPVAATEIRPGSADATTAVLVFLSGRRRGRVERLEEATVFVQVDSQEEVTLVPASGAEKDADYPVLLHRSGGTYELEVPDPARAWVNGLPVEQRMLDTDDVIEIGRNGPMLRFRIYPADRVPHRTAADAFTDCVDCARFAEKNLAGRSGRFFSAVTREVVAGPTFWFRAIVVAILLALVASTVYLSFQGRELEERLAAEEVLSDWVSESLERAEQDAISDADLLELKSALEERVGALETRSTATRNVIAATAGSIVFLQGSYGYLEEATGRPLRYVGIGPDGRPLGTPAGPVVTLEGDGPVIEMEYTGTAFAMVAPGKLVTNRHVAMPWENNPSHDQFIAMGLAPAVNRFIGFLPGHAAAFPVMLVAASDEADLALLDAPSLPADVPMLPASTDAVRPGEEVVVMGYPTGMRAMLARTDERFLEELRGQEELDFWSIAEKLAAEGRITPIASRGIIGQTTTAAVVYDAETTRGGSGGPVLDSTGRVVAVNTAILPEYGGSNIGVPVDYVLALARAIREN